MLKCKIKKLNVRFIIAMSKKERSDSYSHILKYTGLFGGIQALSIGVALVRNKLIALIIGPGGMGLASLFNSTVSFVSDISSFGIGLSAVQRISQAYDDGDEESIAHSVSVVRYMSILLALLGTIVCVAASPFLSWFTFSWNGHTIHFICLSPVVGLGILTLGETAIIKSVRKLRRLALISFYNIVGALVVSVPIYYIWGVKGIVPSLVLMAFIQFLLTIHVSFRLYPFRLDLSKELFHEGFGMLKLGTAFVLSGIFTSGTDFLIRSYLNNVSGIDTVGLYNAGVMMTLTYVSMVFSSMDTDYFPRLSSVKVLGTTLNVVVNRQIEMMFLLISPLLVAFIIILPVILPLLYSGKFLPVLSMAQVIVLAMYFRALEVPIEYITLARGDSSLYLFIQAVYSVIFVGLVILGYKYFGLLGAGAGITLTTIVYFLFMLLFSKSNYGFRLSSNVALYCTLQIPLGVLAYATTFISNPFIYWLSGVMLCLVSAFVSLTIIRKKTNVSQELSAKFKSKFKKS